jgi:hypothetical protein
VDSVRAAIRRKNEALAAVLEADRCCRARRRATMGPSGYGEIPPEWARRKAELEDRYRRSWWALSRELLRRRRAEAGGGRTGGQELALAVRTAAGRPESNVERERDTEVKLYPLWGPERSTEGGSR